MNPSNFKFNRVRPENTPEELQRYSKTPSFLRDTFIDIDRQIADPILSALRELEHKLAYLQGRAGYCFRTLYTKTYKGQSVELIHNAVGEIQAYIIKDTREVVSLTPKEKREFKYDPAWSFFADHRKYQDNVPKRDQNETQQRTQTPTPRV